MPRDPNTHAAWVDRHYAANQPLFSRSWSPDYLRYGLWNPDTWSLREALLNTDRFVAERLAPAEDDDILDAGCGVGGTALHLAATCGCRVTGINLCTAQIALARVKARAAGLDRRVHFEERDYAATGFPDRSFSKILAIESVYHAEAPGRFTDEAFRLLRPGGAMVVADRFLASATLSPRQQRQYERFKAGQAVARLPTRPEFEACLRESGFRDIEIVDQTRQVLRGSRLCSLIAALGYPTVAMLSALRLQPPEVLWHTRSLLAIGRLFSAGAVAYASFVVRKPA